MPAAEDAPSPSDTPATDDAPTPGDAPVASDAPASGELADCQAAAAAYAALCTSDGDRTCHVAAYASFCSEGASPGLYADALDCLRTNSASNSCRTFSDPSGAAGCVDAVYAGATSAAIDGIMARIVELCGGTPGNPARTEPPLQARTATELSDLAACLDAATTCDGAGTCAQEAAGPISVCYL